MAYILYKETQPVLMQPGLIKVVFFLLTKPGSHCASKHLLGTDIYSFFTVLEVSVYGGLGLIYRVFSHSTFLVWLKSERNP